MKDFQNAIQYYLLNHEKQKKYLAVVLALSMLVTLIVPLVLTQSAESMTRNNGILATQLAQVNRPDMLLTNVSGKDGNVVQTGIDENGNPVNTCYSPKQADLITLVFGSGKNLEWADNAATIDEAMEAAAEVYFLGLASDFCAFIEGDFTATEADAEGRMAVGGDLKFTKTWNYQIGSGDYASMLPLNETGNYKGITGFANALVGGKMYRINTLSTGYGHHRTQVNDENYSDGAEGYHTVNSGDKYSYSVFFLPDEGLYKRFVVGNPEASLHYDALTGSDISYGTDCQHDYPGDCGESCQHKYLASIDEKSQFYQYDGVKDIIASAFATVRARSTNLSKQNGIRPTRASDYGEILFEGPGEDSNVKTVYFTVDHWNDYRTIRFTGIPKDANIVINCGGVSVDVAGPYGKNGTNVTTYINNMDEPISKIGEDLTTNNNAQSERLLYNFYEATDLEINGNFNGTILAPNAAVTSYIDECPGHLSGALIAKSFYGGLEFGYRPYRGGSDIVGLVSGYAVPVDKLITRTTTRLSGASLALLKQDAAANGTKIFEWNSTNATRYVPIASLIDFSGNTVYTPTEEEDNDTDTDQTQPDTPSGDTDTSDVLAYAYFNGSIGSSSNWGYNGNPSTVQIKNDGTYEVALNFDPPMTPDSDDQFVILMEAPSGTKNFTSDVYPALKIENVKVSVNGGEFADYEHASRISTNFESKSRIPLYVSWEADYHEIPETEITSIKVAFTISGTGVGTSDENTTGDDTTTDDGTTGDDTTTGDGTTGDDTTTGDGTTGENTNGEDAGIAVAAEEGDDTTTGDGTTGDDTTTGDGTTGDDTTTGDGTTGDNTTTGDGTTGDDTTDDGTTGDDTAGDDTTGDDTTGDDTTGDDTTGDDTTGDDTTGDDTTGDDTTGDDTTGDGTTSDEEENEEPITYLDFTQVYKIVEEEAPEGFFKTDAYYELTVNERLDLPTLLVEGDNKTFPTHVDTTFKIVKVDGDTRTDVETLQFAIDDEYDDNGVKSRTITITNSATGQITAAYKMDINAEKQSISCIYRGTIDTTENTVTEFGPFADNPTTAQIIDEKYYFDPEAMMVMPIPENNLTFENTPGLLFKKVDDLGNPVKNAAIQLLQGSDSITGADLWEWDSESSSQLIDTSKLEDGAIYKFHEASAPAGYLPAENDIFFTKINSTQIEWWEGESGTHNPLDLLRDQTIKMVDRRILGAKLTMAKVDYATNASLDNSLFSLYSSDGTEILAGIPGNVDLYKYEPFLALNNKYVQNGYLRPGEYYLVETQMPVHSDFDANGQIYENPGKIRFKVNNDFTITNLGADIENNNGSGGSSSSVQKLTVDAGPITWTWEYWLITPEGDVMRSSDTNDENCPESPLESIVDIYIEVVSGNGNFSDLSIVQCYSNVTGGTDLSGRFTNGDNKKILHLDSNDLGTGKDLYQFIIRGGQVKYSKVIITSSDGTKYVYPDESVLTDAAAAVAEAAEDGDDTNTDGGDTGTEGDGTVTDGDNTNTDGEDTETEETTTAAPLLQITTQVSTETITKLQIGNKTDDGLTDVMVEKKWAGDGGLTVLRPNSISVQLYRSESEITDMADLKSEMMVEGKTASLTSAGGWKAAFTDLESKYKGDDDKFHPYYYYIKEENVPDGYADSYTVEADGTLVVTNTLDSISIKAEKRWDTSAFTANDDADAYIPDSVIVKLQWLVNEDENGNPINPPVWEDVPNKTLTLKKTGGWTGFFDGLPKDRTYQIVEPSSPSGWVIQTLSNVLTDVQTDGELLHITNAPDLGSLTIEKGWMGDTGSESKRPDEVYVQLYRAAKTLWPDGQPLRTTTDENGNTVVGVVDDYARLLQYALYFYDGVMCGDQVNENSAYYWRGDCHCSDALGYTSETAGGFHDAGDHVMFGLPGGFSASTLGWSLYEFRDEYDDLGQTAHTKVITDYYAEFFMNCVKLDESGNITDILVQKGHGNTDHAYWGIPEGQKSDQFYGTVKSDLDTNGVGTVTEYWTNSSGSDIAAQYAASLALSYLNFHTTDEAKYGRYLDMAKKLYAYAESKNSSLNVWGVNMDELQQSEQYPGFYKSDGHKDDMAWAANWIALALKGTSEYDSFKTSKLDAQMNGLDRGWGGYNWNNATMGAHLAYAAYHGGSWDQVKTFLTSADSDTSVNANNGAGSYHDINNWGCTRYNAGFQTIAVTAAKHQDQGANVGINEDNVAAWAKSQMDYILGANQYDTCFITNFAENCVRRPHYRAGSGQVFDMQIKDDVTVIDGYDYDKNRLIGGLVGGPRDLDRTTAGEFEDRRSDYELNEVASDYNANLVGAAAGLYYFYRTGSTYEIPGVKRQYLANNAEETVTTTGNEAVDLTVQPTNDSPLSQRMSKAFAAEIAGEGQVQKTTKSNLNLVDVWNLKLAKDGESVIIFDSSNNTELFNQIKGNGADVTSLFSGKAITKIEVSLTARDACFRLNNQRFLNNANIPDSGAKWSENVLILEAQDIGGVSKFKALWDSDVPSDSITTIKCEQWGGQLNSVKVYYKAGNTFDVTLNSTAIAAGGSTTLTFDSATEPITWTIPEDSGITIDGNTLTAGTATGEFKITGQDSAGKTGEFTINVCPMEITVLNAKIGETITPVVIYPPANAERLEYSWSTVDGGEVTISEDGTITATKSGKVTITVKAFDEAGNEIKSATSNEVQILPMTIVVHDTVVGEAIEYEVSNAPISNDEVTYMYECTAVDENGLAKIAGENIEFVLIAKDSNGNELARALDTLTITAMSITGPQQVEMDENPTYTTNRTTGTFTWTSLTPEVATIDDKTGILTPVQKGTATIQVSDGKYTAELEVTINNITFQLGIEPQAIRVGGTAVLSPNLEVDRYEYDNTLIKIEGNTVTALAAAESVTITAFATDGQETGATLKINEKLTITSDPDSHLLNIGESLQLTAHNTVGEIEWGSSDPAIAMVDSSGKVTAKGFGTVIITAIDEDGAEENYDVTVNVSGVKVTLPGNAEAVGKPIKLTKDSGWAANVDQLQYIDENGDFYYYYIVEVTEQGIPIEGTSIIYGKGAEYAPIAYEHGLELRATNEWITDTSKLSVTNQKGDEFEAPVQMPSAGGEGTTWYYIAGAAMMLAGIAGYFVLKRKQESER